MAERHEYDNQNELHSVKITVFNKDEERLPERMARAFCSCGWNVIVPFGCVGRSWMEHRGLVKPEI